MEITARILEDSISDRGVRLTSIEATYPRSIHSEMMTHRVFSRSSASSRAVPVKRFIDSVALDPYLPLEYRYNQSGMQPGELMTEVDAAEAAKIIKQLRVHSLEAVQDLMKLGPLSEATGKPVGLHKQWANRYLEPWLWHKTIFSSTEWNNFKYQRSDRYSPDAQKEMRAIADAIMDALESSTPVEVPEGGWHTPFIQSSERDPLSVDYLSTDPIGDEPGLRQQVSAARSCRVSYLNHDGDPNLSVDFKLYDKLVTARPMHAAPLEHVATPDPKNFSEYPDYDFHGKFRGQLGPFPILGNFLGWKQLRHFVCPTYGHGFN